MKRCAVSLMLILLLAVMALPTKAQWVVETSLTTVVYQLPRENIVQRFGVLELGRMWRWGEKTSMQVSLPTGLANPGGEFQATVGWPRVKLQAAAPTLWGPHARIQLEWDPNGPQASAELGLEATWDPLLTYASCAFAPGGWGLKGGVVFAANRSWALGAHLTYQGLSQHNPASSLTYQVYYQPPSGPATELTYTYHLHLAQQRLGIKMLF